MIRPLLALAAATMTAAAAAPALAADPAPAKAYVIVEVEVKDPETYKTYAAQTTPILARFGGKYLARAGTTVPLEGAPPAGRVAVLEFPSLAAAQAFEASPAYLEIAKIRHRTATSRSFIVEGVAP